MTVKELKQRVREFVSHLKTSIHTILEKLSERQKLRLLVVLFALLIVADVWVVVRSFSASHRRIEHIQTVNLTDDAEH